MRLIVVEGGDDPVEGQSLLLLGGELGLGRKSGVVPGAFDAVV
jgi:hypothetical protein